METDASDVFSDESVRVSRSGNTFLHDEAYAVPSATTSGRDE